MSSSPGCPVCNSGDVQRSHRRGLEKMVPSLRAYRCMACAKRFFRFGKRASSFEAAIEKRAAAAGRSNAELAPLF